jgi:hypothetical protein
VANKFCPACGDEFVATVETCPDCEVPLVDEQPDVDRSKTGQVEYELHEWAVESRVMLESLLTGQAVPHAWEGTDLTVPAAFETKVDSLIEQVEVTAEPNLDPDAPKVAYDLTEWDDEQQTELIQGLDARGIPYDFDVDGSLVVLEADDEVVDAVLDEITGDEEDDAEATGAPVGVGDAVIVGDGDGTDGVGDADVDDEIDEDDDGVGDDDEILGADGEELDAQQVMSDLFVAADRLRKKANDHEGVLTLVERAAVAQRMKLPFGFNRRDWDQIVEQAIELRALIEDDESADADITARAAVLRGTLHPYV